MAIALVQSSTEVSVVGTTSGNVTLTVTAGNLLVVTLSQTVANIRTFTVSDGVNTWTNDGYLNGSVFNLTALISSAKNAASGSTTVTVTASGNSTFRFKVHEFSGCDTASPVDQSSSLEEGTAVTSHVTSANSTVIDTVANALVVVASVLNGAATLTVADGNYNNLNSAATTLILWQYRVASGALTDERGPWTSTGTARRATGVIVSYKPAAAGGGVFNPYYYQHLLGGAI